MTAAPAPVPPRLDPSLNPGGIRPAARPTRRLWSALAMLLIPAALLVYNHRPSGQFFFPRCGFHESTGLLCPGCGGLRASHELLHFNLLAAARNNALLVLGPPAVLLWAWLRRRRHLAATPGPREVWIAFGIAAIFTLARNLPWSAASWISP